MWWPDTLLGMLWYYRTEVQDTHGCCPSGFPETVLRLLLSSFSLPSWYQVKIWGKMLFRYGLHFTLMPLCLLDDVLLRCNSSSAGFLISWGPQPRATGQSQSISFCGYGSAPTLQRFVLSCCDVAGFPATVAMDRSHKQEPHLPNPWDLSAVQSSAHAQAGNVAGKPH